MDIEEVKKRLPAGEDSEHQFKENFSSIDQLAAEICAFANSQGGCIFTGVNDLGQICGISQSDVRRLNQWISNATAQKIEPPIFVRTHTLLTDNSLLLIIEVPRGIHKPYCVNKSDFWVKNGADKRRATREQLFRLMQASHRLFADEMTTEVPVTDVDRLRFSHFYRMTFGEDPDESEIREHTLLENLKLAAGGNLTLAGLMLFGSRTAICRPQFSIKGTVYLTEDEFRDKEDIGGNLFEQHRRGTDFILRNLRRIPKLSDFNAPGEVEIPSPAIKEAVANALAHRDYFIDAPVFINLFENRVEIASPGILPNTVTVENIRMGIHIERNPILLSFLAKDPDFGYTGRGIPRLLRLCQQKNVQVTLINDTERRMFRVIFARPVS
ncbi:MAG: putative DNA binding domain-containing protein [Desulfobacterales bacterium]